jgi:hypothetical protein
MLLGIGMGAANAQSSAARAACQADAQKHCASAIPDQTKVRACLVQNKAKLSQACQQAITEAGR